MPPISSRVEPVSYTHLKEAIEEVQNAGIQVVMITGDRLETAVAIAKDAGLLKDESDKALSSAQLNEMSDEEVKAIIPHIRVIARALPTDKSRMVRLCQEMNLVVGMTGDGAVSYTHLAGFIISLSVWSIIWAKTMCQRFCTKERSAIMN